MSSNKRSKAPHGMSELEGLSKQEAERIWLKCVKEHVREPRNLLMLFAAGFFAGLMALIGNLFLVRWNHSALGWFIFVLCAGPSAMAAGYVVFRSAQRSIRRLIRQELGLCRECGSNPAAGCEHRAECVADAGEAPKREF